MILNIKEKLKGKKFESKENALAAYSFEISELSEKKWSEVYGRNCSDMCGTIGGQAHKLLLPGLVAPPLAAYERRKLHYPQVILAKMSWLTPEFVEELLLVAESGIKAG
ncbi:hypothetical protein EVAR_39073_1 [Eumeta japonica]|uniref:Uncharacterized protein n=1 Tax=Eumeta variegata TaxID=151549 RepID=A0A4C1WNW4_EUMVA|nr:hypothetical protein EVAR_39073_1 [Eumeta japonica]